MELAAIFDQNFLDPNTNLLLNQITTYVTKTVGTGKDFETFDESMKWAQKQTFSGSGWLTLSLDDGTHYCSSWDVDNWVFYAFDRPIINIMSTSGNAANCTITIPNTAGAAVNWFDLFQVISGTLDIIKITVDNTADGNVGADNIYALNGYRGATLGTNTARIENFESGVYLDFGNIVSWKTLYNNCVVGALVAGGSTYLDNSTSIGGFTNCDTGLKVLSGGMAHIASTLVFTGNTEDTNIPIGLLKEDGTLIASSGTPIVVENAAPVDHITTKITKTVGSGKDFTTFDLAMKWVMKQTCSGGGDIRLLLDDGNHLIETYDSGTYSCYVLTDTTLTIESATGVRANCVITLPSAINVDWNDIFYVVGGRLSLIKVLVDPAAVGNVLSPNMIIIAGKYGSDVYINRAELRNAYVGMQVKRATGSSYGCFINNCEEAVTVDAGSYNDFSNVSVYDNNVTAIAVNNGGLASLTTEQTFTSNTNDGNHPFGEMQSDGSLIAMAGTPITIKDAAPTDRITTFVTKTVGTGKDFETFDLAMRWAQKQTFSGAGWLSLSLDDGTHYCSTWDSNTFTFYAFRHPTMDISSVSGIAGNCIITIPDTAGAAVNWYDLIQVNGGSLDINGITLDNTAGGNVGAGNVVGFAGYKNARLNTWTAKINNFNVGVWLDGAYLFSSGTLIDNCSKGVSAKYFSNYLDVSSSGGGFTNCGVGISAESGSTISIPSSMIFTSNTADTNIPLSEIQYDGTYIANGASALSFKA